jgi:hypothetical protein
MPQPSASGRGKADIIKVSHDDLRRFDDEISP